MDIRTRSVHKGVNKDSTFNSVITPIYPTSTFYFDGLGKNKGYDYSRSGNPTRTALEQNIAEQEGGVGASATATGILVARLDGDIRSVLLSRAIYHTVDV